MSDPGTYNRAFTWLKRSIAKDTATGQDVESFTAHGTLWGSMRELSASKLLAYGMQNSEATVQLNVRQWPTVSMLDRLQDKQFNYYLVIDGVNHDFGANELVVYAHSVTAIFAESSSS